MGDQTELVVPADLAGSRLDKALSVMLQVSRGLARQAVDDGVSIDGNPAKASDRVSTGQKILVVRPETGFELQPEEVHFEVVVEHNEFIVVDKPAGIVVHPGSGRTKGTLASGLLNRYPEIEGVGQPGRWGIVHRLDRDTSGLLVVARTETAYESLTAQIRARSVEREYQTLIDGEPGAPTGTIEAPIGRDPSRPTRRAVVRGGKPAVTHFEMMETYPEYEASLLRVRLETGRTHQIRVHFASIDHQVIGDKLYGKKKTLASSPRVFLHSFHLGFAEPVTDEWVEVEIPLAADLAGVLVGMST